MKENKTVSKRKAQQFCQALYMSEFQLYYSTTRFEPLEMGTSFGIITDMLFEFAGTQFKWDSMTRKLQMI